MFVFQSHPGGEKGFGEGILVSSGLHLAGPWEPCRPRAMQEVMKQLPTLSLLPGEDRLWLPAQAIDGFPQPYAPVPP